jgi:DNA replication protein DnaC
VAKVPAHLDEVRYIPFDPEAAALFFAPVSSRYERRSLIVSSNKTSSTCAEIFGDAADRHADHG